MTIKEAGNNEEPSVNDDPSVWNQRLLSAANWGDKECVIDALDHGANINVLGIEGKTALHLAARAGELDTVSILVDRGANVNATDYSARTPLHDAASTLYTNGRSPPENNTIVKLLLDRGADPAAYDTNGRTPVIAAREAGNHAIAEILQRYETRSGENAQRR